MLIMGMLLLLASGCSMQDMAGGNPFDRIGGMGDPYIESSRGEIAKKKAAQLQSALELYNQQAQSEGRDYFTGPNDVLKISIQSLEQPGELSTFRRSVTQNGMVLLPLIGEIHVAGRNTRTIESMMASAYDGAYLKDPQVTVSLTDYKSAPVVVNGAVGKPGIVYLTYNHSSVLEVLSMVAGLDAIAGDELIIVRDSRLDPPDMPDDPTSGTPLPDDTPKAKEQTAAQETEEPGKTSFIARLFSTEKPAVDTSQPEKLAPGNITPPTPEKDKVTEDAHDGDQQNGKQTIIVNLERLIKRGDTRLNLAIYGGDTITVPPRKSLYVYVNGFVKRPGQIKIPSGVESVRALHAISMAGGLDSTARAQKCKLIREGHKPVHVDLTKVVKGKRPPVYLEPGDQFIVGATAMSKFLDFVNVGISGGADLSTP